MHTPTHPPTCRQAHTPIQKSLCFLLSFTDALKGPPETCPDWNLPKYPFSYQAHTVPDLSPIALIPPTSQLIPHWRHSTPQSLRGSLWWWIFPCNVHHRCWSAFILNHISELPRSQSTPTDERCTFMSSCQLLYACVCLCLFVRACLCHIKAWTPFWRVSIDSLCVVCLYIYIDSNLSEWEEEKKSIYWLVRWCYVLTNLMC